MASAPGTAPDEPPVGAGSRLALVVLVALVVLTPWAAGGVEPVFTRTIAIVSLTAALLALALDARFGALAYAPVALWPIAGLWLLAVVQLVPLPAAFLQLIAPGPASVWYPSSPAAAEVLGTGPRPISIHPEATRRTLALGTGVVALALAAVPALRKRRLLLRAAVAIVAGGVAVALYALVARLAFGNKLYGIWSVPTVAPFGPFVNKNHFAGYIELTALLAVGLASGLASEARRGPDALSWIESRRARWVVAAWGAAAILILAVPVSLSRGGVLSLCAGLAAFVGLRLWSRREKRIAPARLLAASTAAVLVFACFVAILPAESRDRMLSLAGVTSEQSGSFRLGIWRDTLRLVSTSPWLGSGFGAFQDALPRFKTAAGHLAVEHAESDYLELLAEGGVVGALLTGALVGLVLARGMLAAASARERLRRGLAFGALAALVAIGIHSTFDFNLRIPSNAMLCTALLAIVPGAVGDERLRAARPVASAALTVALALALFTPWAAPHVEPGPLLRLAGNASSALRRAELEADLASHIRRRPADAPAWLAIAWARLPASRGEAASLAAWAVALDPTSDPVRSARARLDALRSH